MTKNKKIIVSSGIDWISCTFDISLHLLFRNKLVFFGLVESTNYEKITPLHGYLNAIQLLGGRFQWGFKEEKAYCHLTLTGQGCSNLGGSIWDLLFYLKSLNVNFTRIDLAFDFQGIDQTMKNIEFDLNNNRFSGFRSFQRISTTKNNIEAVTYYIGSRSCDHFLRVYDKGLESGQCKKAGELIRFEFVFRSDRSNFIVNILSKDDVIVKDIAGLTFNLFKFGHNKKSMGVRTWIFSKWYKRILDSFENLTLRSLPSVLKNHNYEGFCKWLSLQVSPQLKCLGFPYHLTVGQVLDIIMSNYPNSLNPNSLKNSYVKPFRKMYYDFKEMKK